MSATPENLQLDGLRRPHRGYAALSNICNRLPTLHCLTLVLFISCLRPAYSAVQHVRLNTNVQGEWSVGSETDFSITDGVLELDFNNDSISELQIQHTYVTRSVGFSANAVEMLSTALSAEREIYSHLTESRQLSIDLSKAWTSVDHPRVAIAQSRLESLIDEIDRIARDTSYQSRRLLDGTAGPHAISTHSDVSVPVVTTATRTGTYAVDVVQPGERASVSAVVAQTEPLTQDETLWIQGYPVQLLADDSPVTVLDRVNERTGHTNIAARTTETGELLLYNTSFGRHDISVVSNYVAEASSSGFGMQEMTGLGTDVEAEISGVQYRGTGRSLFVNSGPATGMTVSFAPSHDDITRTVDGPQGIIRVRDGSLKLIIVPDTQTVIDVAIPSFRTEALGRGNSGGVESLADVRLGAPTWIQESIIVINQAISSVEAASSELESTLETYGYPIGVGEIDALGQVNLMQQAGELVWLNAGDFIGPESSWNSISTFEFRADVESPRDQFLGIEFFEEGRPIYGWLRLDINPNGSLAVHDFAFDSSGAGILAGAVPEPPSHFLIFLSLLALAASRHRAPKKLVNTVIARQL